MCVFRCTNSCSFDFICGDRDGGQSCSEMFKNDQFASFFQLNLTFSQRRTAIHPPPSFSVLCIFFSHTNYLHVLSHIIQKSPLCLLPGSSILIILLPIYSLSVLCTCPNHLNLASLTLSPRRLTRVVPLMCSFLILSILVAPTENLSVFNSVSSLLVGAVYYCARDTHLNTWNMKPAEEEPSDHQWFHTSLMKSSQLLLCNQSLVADIYWHLCENTG